MRDETSHVGPQALIFGAGRIGRGFLGQLLHRGGYAVHFVDGAPSLVAALAERGCYRIDIAGRPELNETIPVAGSCTLTDVTRLRELVQHADLLACAVGAGNLAALAATVGPALAGRTKPVNWLICENAEKPAQTLRTGLVAAGVDATWATEQLGLVETQVLRSGMDAEPATLAIDPLAVRMQDWWTLPCDADAFRGGVPPVPGLEPRRPFANELTRKVFTFNGLNGPIAYLGARAGHHLLHESAHDPRLQALFAQVKDEANYGLVREFGVDPGEQVCFQELAWKKYRDPTLADPIARHARDSARKLGPTERLVGPAMLCLRHGRQPLGYAAAIAAAIGYWGAADDLGSARVQADLAAGGVEAVLRAHCQLDPSGGLGLLVMRAWPDIEHQGKS